MSEADHNKYWKSFEERDADPDFLRAAADEFPGDLPVLTGENDGGGLPLSPPGFGGDRVGRRSFLKLAGFSAAIVTATGCSRAPVQKAIPLLVQPEAIVPGRSLSYASTCDGCSAGCGVLVKVRDGRPIKLEGNLQHALSRGGLCAAGQASILGLYDSQRLKRPLKNGSESTWDKVDHEIADRLRQPGAVRFLSGTITSPTLRAAIADFLKPFPDAHHVEYDALSSSAILDAHQRTHGRRVLPGYHFDLAEVIVSFDADFLGTWISPVQFTADWRRARDLAAKRFSYHVQFEPRLSVTGAKADRRVAIAPDELPTLLSALADRIKKLSAAIDHRPSAIDRASESKDPYSLQDLAARLWSARGKSLIVSGSNDLRVQLLVNDLNQLLGNYGNTLSLDRPSLQAQGNDRELEAVIAELRDGKVQTLFIYGANPAYDLPGDVTAALKKVPLLVAFSPRLDETAALAHYVCPEAHFLESWRDAEPVAGAFSLTQPAIRPLFDTRPAIESLAAWSGRPKSAYDQMRDFWRDRLYRQQSATFDEFWDSAVQTGYVELNPRVIPSEGEPKARAAFARASETEPRDLAVPPSTIDHRPSAALQLVLYPTVAMLDGRHAFNPWLHELPDPIAKLAWDNAASVSPGTAQRLRLSQGDIVRLQVPGAPALELPVYIQPGQHDAAVAVALGYGSRLSARFANIGPRWIDALPSVDASGLVGFNAAPLLRFADGQLLYTATGVTLTRTGKHQDLACTQVHNTLTVPANLAPPDARRRPIVQETTLTAYQRDPHSGVEDHVEKQDLWPADHPFRLHWGMVIDLAACTGCSACVIACQAENNIPVVGKDEIRRNREMHWLRVDRYYTDLPGGEIAVAHQPMMCQQCENAPCETVCPVLATVHSEDGLNSQVYNRCVGTRYCANNCPYKARRFNWFSYRRDDALQNLILNPDVAVRSRGVMEKCSFCVQRLQEAKIDAKTRGVPVADGAAQTACQQSCPAQAITFGNLDDPKSQVSRMMQDPRRYRVLSELNVRPSVGYLTVVRKRPDTEEENHG